MPTGFVWLGIVSGVFLAVGGILGGVLLPKDIYLLVTGGLDWSNLNPFMYVIFGRSNKPVGLPSVGNLAGTADTKQ